MYKKQVTIPLSEYDRPTRREIGAFGERLCAAYTGGYKPHKRHSGDLIAPNGARIEVKTSMLGNDGAFRFRLFKNDRYGYTDHRHSDYVVLVAIDNMRRLTLYLIPTWILENQKAIGFKPNSTKYIKYVVSNVELRQIFAV